MMQRLFLLFGAILLIVGCAHLPPEDYGFQTPDPGQTSATNPPTSPGYSPGPTTTPSSSSSSTPGPCPTQDVSDPNVVYVSVNPDVTPTKDPAGNAIFGYATIDINSGGFAPGASAIISMTSSEVLQFVNTDTNPNNVTHSAVGFTGSTFPAVPYTFPSGSDTASGTQITNTASGGGSPWSTGEIQSGCFSQTFTVKAGTYYFGDFNTYNSAASMRDEVVVTP